MARLSPPPLPPPHTHTQYYGIHVVLTLANYEPNLGGIQVRGPVYVGRRILSRPDPTVSCHGRLLASSARYNLPAEFVCFLHRTNIFDDPGLPPLPLPLPF